MSVKPVAWMDEHGCTCNDDEKVVRGPGFDIPLYAAPGPELAEALQKLVDWDKGTDDPVAALTNLAFLVADAKKLLARITPK